MQAAHTSHSMHTVRRGLAIAVGALALACGGAQAQSHGGWHGGGGGWHGGGHSYYHGGGWGFDPFWGLGVGLGIGLATAPLYYDNPGVVYVNPPVYYPPAPVYVTQAPVAPAAPAPAAAEPIFYPRNGQTAQQTEADRQDCNRWATTQRNAMADGSVFQRATFACMDGRGYTAR